MIRFKTFVILFMYLWNTSEVNGQIVKPTIYPKVADSVVTPPRDLTLGCEGVGLKNVTWTIPDNSEFWRDKNIARRVINKDEKEEALPKYITRTKDKVMITYMNETDKNDKNKINAAALLVLKNVTYNDIGNYYCHVIGASVEDEEKSSKIFIFVKDKKRLAFLEKDKTYIINEKSSEEYITFPCIPTDPNITVKLKAFFSEASVYHKSYIEIPSEVAPYNNHIGYTLKSSEINFDKYMCEFVMEDLVEQIYFKIQFNHYNDYSNKPYINYTEDFIKATSGQDLKLTCTAALDLNNSPNLLWEIPNKLSQNVKISNYTISLYKGWFVASTLYVTDLSESDAGEYKCMTTTEKKNKNESVAVATKYVTIDLDSNVQASPTPDTTGTDTIKDTTDTIEHYTTTDTIEHYTTTEPSKERWIETTPLQKVTPSTKPKINATSNNLTIQSGQDLILSCQGTYRLIWQWDQSRIQSGIIIKNGTHTNSNSPVKHESVIYLKIINASYYHTGLYYCYQLYSINNRYYTEKYDADFSSEIFVYVKDNNLLNSNPTDINIKSAQYSTIFIPCIPTSPEVKVSLINTSNSQKLNEEYIQFKGFKYYLPTDDIIYLECKYEMGQKIEIQKVIIDVQKSFNYENLPYVTSLDHVHSHEGGDLVLICAVIVKSDFSPNISWATPEQPEFLATQAPKINDIRYFVSNHEQVVISTITVIDVKLGEYREYACSFIDEEEKMRSDRQILSLNTQFDIKPYIETQQVTAEGETLIVNCTVRADHNVRFNMTWEFPGNSNDARITETKTIKDYDVFGNIGTRSLIIQNVKYEDAGNYTCKIRDHKNNRNKETVFIRVQDPTYPMIITSNMYNRSKILKVGDFLNLECTIDENDIPKPMIYWYKDDDLLNYNGSQVLSKTYIQKNDSGIYSCRVSNRLGMISRWVRLEVKEVYESNLNSFVAVISVLLIAFLILISIFVYRVVRERRFQSKLKSVGLVNFEEGQVQNINPNICISDQAELLPYDKKWEVPRDRVKIGIQLGSGEFGVVMKGEIFGVFMGETIKTVAIKMLHRHADAGSIKALVNELKIMTYIGKHLNVVNLLGACTRNIKKREILIITEYCCKGSLRGHLLTNRDNFINQIDPESGLIDIDNIDPLLYKKVIPSEDELSKLMNPYTNLEDKSEKRKLDYRTKQAKEVAKEKNDYETQEKHKHITTHDLICWSFQVARGMDYLSSRRILHGDLAARNVLLSDCNIVKICDFGLAKNMYKYKHYEKKSKIPLPVKWMAIESIRDRIFSVQSDVWSFGVTLWEIFSLARTPYPGRESDSQFLKDLENGLRMDQPGYATSSIYQIMRQCWEEKPSERLTFPQLTELLGSMIHQNVKKHYIELNKPYENLNITEGAPNYLQLEDVTENETTASGNEKENTEDGLDKLENIEYSNTNQSESQIRKRIRSNVDVEDHNNSESVTCF